MDFVFEPGLPAVLFWLVTLAWLLEPLLIRSARPRRRSLRGSLEFLVILLAMLAAFGLNGWAHRHGIGVAAGELGSWLLAIGLLVYGAGVSLRYWAGRALGEWFTRDLEVHDDHRLVSHGPYAWLRHPLYSALVIATLGLGLLFRTPGTAACGALLVALATLPRIRREERLLEERLGGEYRGWATRRARLVPGLF